MTARRAMLAATPAVALLLVLFAAPVAGMVVGSFRARDGAFPSLELYQLLATQDLFVRVFAETIALGLAVTAICLVLGLPLAWAYVRGGAATRNVLLFAVAAPLLISMVVRVYGWTILLGPGGLLDHVFEAFGVLDPPRLMYNMTGVIIGMVHVFLPFMVLTLVSSLVRIDLRLYESAAILGAGWWRTHRTVTVPLIRPGIVAGSVLVFALTQGAFVTPLVLGGTAVKVTATLVYTDIFVLFDWPRATAMATVLLVAVLGIVVVQSRVGRPAWMTR